MCVSEGSPTYQLKLPTAVVGVLDARVGPQGFDGRQVPQEVGRLQLPAGHLGRARVERHQAVAVLLVVRVTPGDVQLLPGVHQHTDACGRRWGVMRRSGLEKIKGGVSISTREEYEDTHVPVKNSVKHIRIT